MITGEWDEQFLSQIGNCTGCDYLGIRSFSRISVDTRVLNPDDSFLRFFPFCYGINPLPFSFWLDGLGCSPDTCIQIMDACDLVCSAKEGHTFSSAPLIVSLKRENGGSILYSMMFHAGGGQPPSFCLTRYPEVETDPPVTDWSCLDSMNEAVIILKPDARVYWANRVARRELSPAGMETGVPVSTFWKRVLWDKGTCPMVDFICASWNAVPQDVIAEDSCGRFWRIRTGLLGNSKDSFAGFIQTAVEMTEWMDSRAQLNEIQQRFETFMEHIPSAAFILDLDGTVQYCNPYMEQYFCPNRCGNTGDVCPLPQTMIQDLRSLFPEVLNNGCLSVERRHMEPEKCDQAFQLTLFPIMRTGERPLIGAITVDLTEVRKNEMEREILADTLLEAQKVAQLGIWDYHYENGVITFHGISPYAMSTKENPVSMPLEGFLNSLMPEEVGKVRQAVCDRSADSFHELMFSMNNTSNDVEYVGFRARSRTDGIAGTVGTIQDITDKVKAEEARAQSEEQFRLYFNSNMSGSMIIEPIFSETGKFTDFRFISVNWSFARMMGVEQESIIGMTALEVFPDDAGQCISSFRDTIMRGGSCSGEFISSQTGMIFSGYIFRLGESQPYYGCSFIDISAEREALRVLKENDEFLNIIFPVTIEGILVIDAETHTIQDLNATACDLIGRGREEIIGCPCRDLICPVRDGLCPVTDLGKEVYRYETVIPTADGSWIPIIKSVKQVVYQGRKCLIEMIVDLREVKAAEEALTLAEKRYRMVFETTPDGILITDTYEINEVNTAFAKELGYTPNEMKGCSVLDFAPKYQSDGFPSSQRRDDGLKEILGGSRIKLQWDALSREGQLVHLEVRGGFMNVLGKIMVVLVGRNITEMIHMREQKREALDQIEENLASLATLNDHIRNPLMVISAYTEMDASEHGTVIMDQIREIDGIINSLDMGFLESEKIREFLRKHHDVDNVH